MKMRKILAFVLVAILAFSMFGCAKKTPADSSGEKNTEAGTKAPTGEKEDVSLVVWGAEEDQAMLQEMIDAFKVKYADEANFTIELGVQSESTAKDTVLTDPEVAADVFAFANDQIKELVNAKALLEVIPDYADTVKSENGAGSVNAATIDGKLYAYPMTADNGYFLFYNKEFFTEDDVKTMDGILAAAEKAGKQFTMEMNNAWYTYSFFAGAGLTVKTNGNEAECNWNATDTDITGVDVAEAILAITGHKAYINLDDAGFSTGVKEGTIIAGINGTWNAETASATWGENYAAAKLPTYTVDGEQVQMGSFAGYKLIGVNGYTSEPYWASTMAAWLTNYENQVTRFETRGLGPSNTKAASAEEVLTNPAIAALAAQSAYAAVQDVNGSFWSPVNTFGQNMVDGVSTDLQGLLDAMVVGIETPVAAE